MYQLGIGERLSNKLKLSCHKNQIQIVIIDWLINGSVEEKIDANNVVLNCEESLALVNGLNHQINPQFKKEDFFRELNKMLENLLTKNEEFSNKKTRNRKNIEIRGWLLTMYAQTLSEKKYKEGLKILNSFINEDCDRKVTIYWAIIAILYNLPHLKNKEKLKYINKQFESISLNKDDKIERDRIYWLFVIWYINNNDSNIPNTNNNSNLNSDDELNNNQHQNHNHNQTHNYNQNQRQTHNQNQNQNQNRTSISSLLESPNIIPENDSIIFDKYTKEVRNLLSQGKKTPKDSGVDETLTELFVALSCKPCIAIIKSLQLFVDYVIEKDLNYFWKEKDIHMYKYLIICLRNYGRKEMKKYLGDIQENIYYKLFKLLSISRNYSSRIWNEIKLQILKSLRLYNRTTNKKILDELKEELLDTDLSIVFEACKTLKSIYEIDNCLKIVIEVLYNQSIKNVSFSDKKIFAISYSLKILSLKETNLINSLQDLEQGIDDYNKKNIIRKLFTEMGGMKVIKKSQQNNDIREKYMSLTTTAQNKVEEMFHKSIDDAKSAFKISLCMNVIVFMMGILLLGISGILAIVQRNEDNWAGVGVSSGTGFLSVVYSLFINKPSRKIRKNTNHLMRLKVIFLGYLRELTQMDQSFSKNLLDNENISHEVLDGYISKIKQSMQTSLDALRWEELLNKHNSSNISAESLGLDTSRESIDKNNNTNLNFNLNNNNNNSQESNYETNNKPYRSPPPNRHPPRLSSYSPNININRYESPHLEMEMEVFKPVIPCLEESVLCSKLQYINDNNDNNESEIEIELNDYQNKNHSHNNISIV